MRKPNPLTFHVVRLAAVCLISGSLLPVALSGSARADVPAGPGSGAPLIPPAQICGNGSVLDGPSVQPAGSVRVDPNQNLSDVSMAYPPWTTFWLSSGKYLLGTSVFGQVIPKDHDTYIGAPGAVIDGQHINRYAFTQQAVGVTISYLTIQNFGSPGGSQNEGVVNHDGGSGWKIEHDTVRDDAGAGLFAGTDNIVRFNCLQSNGQYGFSLYSPVQGSLGNVLIDHNEISGNNADDWETRQPGCGCTGGGKFWDSHTVTVTSNWVHDNRGVGLWADTNNYGFNVDHNYIANNDAEGIFFELSYNSRITNNTLAGNAVVKGKAFAARSDNFPIAAIYISESGGDSRVNGGVNPTLDIVGNVLNDNWGGVVLWENADRFCGNGFSGVYCSLVNPSIVSPASCMSANIRSAPYFSDCRWKTQNVNVSKNLLTFHKADVGCVTSDCGQQALLSNFGTYPSWSPYIGRVTQTAITYNQNNHFTANIYVGDWVLTPFETGSYVSFGTWQAAPYGQDYGSFFLSGTTITPPL